MKSSFALIAALLIAPLLKASPILIDFGPLNGVVAEGFSDRDARIQLLGPTVAVQTDGDALRNDGIGGVEGIELSLSRGFWRIGLWLNEPLDVPGLWPGVGRKVSDEFTLHWYDDVKNLRQWIQTQYLRGPLDKNISDWHLADQRPVAVFNLYSTGQPTLLTLEDLDGRPLFIAGLIASKDESQFEQTLNDLSQPLPYPVGPPVEVPFQAWDDSIAYQVADEWTFYDLPETDQDRLITAVGESAQTRLFYAQPTWQLIDSTLHMGRNRLIETDQSIPSGARVVLGVKAQSDTVIRISGELGDAPRYREIRTVRLASSERPELGLFYAPQPVYDWFNRSPRKSMQCDLELLKSLGLDLVSLDNQAMALALDTPIKTQLAQFNGPVSSYESIKKHTAQSIDQALQAMWWTATDGPAESVPFTPVSEIDQLRQWQPTLNLMGFVNHREDVALAQSLDLAFLGEGFGLTAYRLRSLDPDRIGLFNLPNPRFKSGVFSAKFGIKRGLYWHARAPTGYPLNPFDGPDVQWIQPDSTCDRPKIDAKLLTLVEAISDWRIANQIAHLGLDFDTSFSGDDYSGDLALYRWRQSVLQSARGLMRP